MKRLRYMKYNKPSPTFCCFIFYKKTPEGLS